MVLGIADTRRGEQSRLWVITSVQRYDPWRQVKVARESEGHPGHRLSIPSACLLRIDTATRRSVLVPPDGAPGRDLFFPKSLCTGIPIYSRITSENKIAYAMTRPRLKATRSFVLAIAPSSHSATSNYCPTLEHVFSNANTRTFREVYPADSWICMNDWIEMSVVA